jgi:S-DNA-T family DNA segregation ATPase FtsK/SpoIIIE
MRCAIAQLAKDPENHFVLIDAKWGYGLAPLAHIPGLVAPIANDVVSAKKALAWAVSEMKRRYETGSMQSRLIVVIDEIQELTGKGGDAAATEMARRLISQGRQARVHVLAGTQHPTKEAFSDSSIRRNLVGRMALKTEDAVSSLVVVGGPQPRADHLLGCGDAYAIVPGGAYRAQLAYIPEKELVQISGREPEIAGWPDFNPEDFGNLPDSGPGWSYSPEEYAISLTVAHEGKGRPALMQALEDYGLPRPGSDRAARLLKIANQMNDWLLDHLSQFLLEA